MLKDEVIAQLHLIAKDIMRGDTPIDDSPDSVVKIEVETLNFVLTVDIDRGTCVDCEIAPPRYDQTTCEQCARKEQGLAEVIDLDDYRDKE